MKKIFILFLLLSGILAKAQNFEGIITWQITSEITDPEVKAQMEASKKKMEDPETQAQMKEMQEKMNDPEFKKMLEANPQMKAQMETAMKMTQGGDMSSVVPKGYNVKIKNQNMLTSMDGGMMADIQFLYLSGKDQSYKIDRAAKTYSAIPPTQEKDSKDKMDVKVTKTSETAKLLDYTCTKYIVESTTNGQKMEQAFWTTTEIKGVDFKNFSKQRMGASNQQMWYGQIEGVPLKMEMKMPQGTMVMVVESIKKESLPASDFALPSDYKEVALKF